MREVPEWKGKTDNAATPPRVKARLYLLAEGRWSETKKVIAATDFGVELKREPLVRYVEENELESDLRFLVSETWKDVEAKCRVERKKRYS